MVGVRRRAVIVRITLSYSRAMTRHGIVAGTEPARAMARVIRELQAAEALPLMGDVRAVIPPAMEAWVRSVPGTSFQLVYVVTPADVALFTIWVR